MSMHTGRVHICVHCATVAVHRSSANSGRRVTRTDRSENYHKNALITRNNEQEIIITCLQNVADMNRQLCKNLRG
jgi:hypothetical protein